MTTQLRQTKATAQTGAVRITPDDPADTTGTATTDHPCEERMVGDSVGLRVRPQYGPSQTDETPVLVGRWDDE